MWNRTGPNTVPLPEGVTPETLASVNLYGHGERWATETKRRLLAFRVKTETVAGDPVATEKGEEIVNVERVRVLDGGATFTKDGRGVVIPGDFPPKDWTAVTVECVTGEGGGVLVLDKVTVE